MTFEWQEIDGQQYAVDTTGRVIGHVTPQGSLFHCHAIGMPAQRAYVSLDAGQAAVAAWIDEHGTKE